MKIAVALLLCLTTLVGFAQRDTVHVVFKTHLDVGFTDLAPKVIEKYFNEYIPNAIHTGRALQNDGDQKFIWTTGSWIISEYLKTASPDKRKELESAIRDGLISWNAFPFTADEELMDVSLFRFSLSISNDLDKQFRKKTLAAKLTDIPGETIGAVHIMNENGIRLLHIGVNEASMRADTPPVFLWKDPQGGEIVVVYENNYGKTTRISWFNHVLQFAFTNDNNGPQTPEQVKSFYKELKDSFPQAVVMASTLNDYAAKLWKIRNRLPVIASEIGNTWIHSAGTDPKKYAALRTLMRLRSHWISENKVNQSDAGFKEFSTNLLLLTEHTGGIDEKSTIDFDHYTVDELASVIKTPPYQRMEQSWEDARAYAGKAVDALGNSSLADEARKELAKLTPQKPAKDGYRPISLTDELQTEHFNVRFDPETGAISSLTDRTTKKLLVDGSVPLGLFWHESFSEEDYKHWADQYLQIEKEWAIKDFCKPNVGKHGAISAKRLPKVVESLMKKTSEGTSILMKMNLNETGTVPYGLPAEIWIQVDFPVNSKNINYTVQWFDKKASRLPDAYWFSMGFSSLLPQNWRIEKLDRMVDPLNMVSKGGRHLHGFNRGVFYADGQRKIEILSPDCPVVAPGSPSLLDFNDKQPDLTKGWHFNLFNNKWGTNFPTWYRDDAMFRFTVSFDN